MHLLEFLLGKNIRAILNEGNEHVIVTDEGYKKVQLQKYANATGPCSLSHLAPCWDDDHIFVSLLVGEAGDYQEVNLIMSVWEEADETTGDTVEHLDYLYMGASWERVANSTVGIPGTTLWTVCPEDEFPEGSLFDKAATEFYHVLDMAKDIYDQGDVSWEDAILTAKFEYAKPGNLFLAHATLEDLLQELGVL